MIFSHCTICFLQFKINLVKDILSQQWKLQCNMMLCCNDVLTSCQNVISLLTPPVMSFFKKRSMDKELDLLEQFNHWCDQLALCGYEDQFPLPLLSLPQNQILPLVNQRTSISHLLLSLPQIQLLDPRRVNSHPPILQSKWQMMRTLQKCWHKNIGSSKRVLQLR